jgi:catechol 2,3-dioxygenase-like lactoylglutathione lyase family enzyme
MLADARVEAAIPVIDLETARAFYEERLGLAPAGAHNPGVDVLYACGGATTVLVYERGGPLGPSRTAAHFVVDDVPAAVRALRERGVVFEEYDLPELQMADGVATIGDRRFAWFKDPDLNVIGLHD